MMINGDDFGFSSGVNHAIIEAHDRGVLTSASLMVSGTAFEEAVALAKARPTLAVGLHLVLTHGQAVLPPEQIPHLVNAQGFFADYSWLGWYYQFNSAARRELQLEIRAQLEKFCQTGLPLSHVDGHLHLHLHPVVLRHLVKLKDEFNIQFMRLIFEEVNVALAIDPSDRFAKVLWSAIFGGLSYYGRHLMTANGIQSVDRVYGFLQSGRVTEDYLLQLIPKIQANRVEIYSHPAKSILGEPSNSPWGLGLAELEALLSDRVREQLIQNGFTLTNYREQ
jgi:hopanoid biosynthesis associated protein HpnK